MASSERAIVIGASISGLLAARALADHYDEVLVLERDQLPSAAGDRKGVPQGRHAHALLAAGLGAFEGFFPGFTGELVDQGGVKTDISRARWFDNGGYHARCTGIGVMLVSRRRLEAHVRTRVTQLPNVQVRSNCDVGSLATEGPDRRIVGVVQSGDGGVVFRSDLVVDATGRGSRTPAWLHDLGFGKPPEEKISVDLGYSTRTYRRLPEHLGGDAAMIVVPTPPGRRGAVMLSLEDDRWVLTLIGMLGDHPPLEENAYLEFARSLPAPDIHDLIRVAEPLTDPIPIRFPASTRHRYEKMTAFPERFLVFGDAICSFNPIYGQGMSVAALQAVALERSLAGNPDGLALRFFRAAAKVLEAPWTIAVGGDLRYPGINGPRTPMVRFINWYLGKLHVAARSDGNLSLAFQKVANLQVEPSSLLRPNVALRVLRGNL